MWLKWYIFMLLNYLINIKFSKNIYPSDLILCKSHYEISYFLQLKYQI